jgi:hypothetical protein
VWLFGAINFIFAFTSFPGDVKNWYDMIATSIQFLTDLDPAQKVALCIGVVMWLSLLPWRKWIGKDSEMEAATWADLMPCEDLLRSRLETLYRVAEELDGIGDPHYYKFIQYGVVSEIPDMISQMFGKPCAKRYLEAVNNAAGLADREGYSENIKGKLIFNAAQNFVGSMIVKKIDAATKH